MLRYKFGQWEFSPATVTYKQDGRQGKNHVGSEGKTWWEELSEKGIISQVEFQDVEYNEIQQIRLDEVNELNIRDGHSTALSQYVITGEFPDDVGHVLSNLELKKIKGENEMLKLRNDSNSNLLELQEEVLQDVIFQIYE